MTSCDNTSTRRGMGTHHFSVDKVFAVFFNNNMTSTESLTSPFSIRVTAPESLARQVANQIRERIAQGYLQPEEQLPHHRKLAEGTGVSPSTVNGAVLMLVKEGWLIRRHGSGTFVRQREKTLKTVGVYYPGHALARPEHRFLRTLYRCLQTRITETGRVMSGWDEVRPEDECNAPWPALAEAAQHRELDALIAIHNPVLSASWLSRLPIPFAAPTGAPEIKAQAWFDVETIVEDCVRAVAKQGSRSVGLIAPLYPIKPGQVGGDMFDHFHAAVAATGLRVRDNWVLSLNRFDGRRYSSQNRCGYEAFLHLWGQAERPDSVIVLDDVQAEGVVTAALECGVRVPRDVRFVFGKHAETDTVCPFPVTFAEITVDDCARALLDLVERQFAGRPVAPVVLGCRMIEGGGERQGSR